MAIVLFVLMNLSAIEASRSLTRVFFHDETPAAKALIAIALFPLLILFTLLLLGTLHLLSAGMALAVSAAVLITVRIVERRSSPAPVDAKFRQTEDAPGHAPWNVKEKLSLALLAFAAGPMIARAVLAGPHMSFDDLKYHASYPTWWLQDGGFTFEHAYSFHAYYPFNAEVFALWFVLPFGQDAYATLAGAYWCVLLAASLVVLLLTLGRSLSQALLLPALVVSMSIVPVSVLRYAAVDIAGVGAIVAALALAVACKPRSRVWVVTGLLSGIAVGSKLTYVPAAVVLAGWMFLRMDAGPGFTARMKQGALHLTGVILSGSFWYLHNVWLTGNPFFPAPVGPFSGPLPASHLFQQSLFGWIKSRRTDLDAIASLVQSHLDWPWPHFVIATAGVGICAFLLLKRRTAVHERGVTKLALVMIAVIALSYLVMPGSAPDDLASVEAKTRFLILLSSLGLLVFSLIASRSMSLWPLYFGVTLLCVLAGWKDSILAASALVFALGVLILTGRFTRRIGEVLPVRRYPMAVCALLLLGLAFWQPVAQRLTDDRLFSRKGETAAGWRKIDDLRAGTSVASIGTSSSQIYPLFGRALTLHPLVGDWRGGLRKPMHELWNTNPDLIEWMESGPPGNVRGLLSNLRKAGVDVVFLSRSSSGEWPPHLAELSSLGDDRLLFRDEQVQIWRIREAALTP